MRAVVVPNPGFGQVLCLSNTVELEPVEDVFTEDAVEPLDVTVLTVLGQATLLLSSNIEPTLGVDAVQSLMVDHMVVLADAMVHLPKSQ